MSTETAEPEVDPAALAASFKTAADAAFKHDKPEPIIEKPVEPKVVTDATTEKPVETKVEPVKTEPEKPVVATTNKQLREAYDKTVNELKETKALLADFEGTRKERDELKARAAELEESVKAAKKIESVAALELSDGYQKKVQAETAQLNTLKELAADVDISPDELLAALGKPRKEQIQALDSLLNGVSRFAADEIFTAIKAIQNSRAERAAEIASAETLMQQRLSEQTSSQRRASEEKARVRDEAWKSVLPLAKQLGLDQADLADAETIFRSNKDARKAGEIVLTYKAFSKQAAKLAELEAELEGYRGASPGIKAGASRATPTTTDLDHLSLSERMNEEARRAFAQQ